ncbi:MAG: HlyD family efflux transporter periplasmic adaptor subunit [Pirellulales bacterium]|nr:HlyD family efflux transporter periplasmic adaptor subunit [Pirellulales bacterium]
MISDRSSARTGASPGLLLLILAAVAVLAVGGFMLRQVEWASETTGPIMHTVKRSDFIHEVTEKGSVESAHNVEIKCEVESRGRGEITILSVVPEGTIVEEGDLLVELDSSALRNDLTEEKIKFHESLAAQTKAENDLHVAELALKEYLEGQYLIDLNLKLREKFVAEEALRQAKQVLEYSQGLEKRGYISRLRVETDEIAVEKAKIDLQSAEKDVEVLKEYTKEKRITELQSAIDTAKSDLEAKKAKHELDARTRKLIEDQIEKCTIKAESPGQVVYANLTERWRDNKLIIAAGTKIYEHQTILRLPDPRQMRVKAEVNESKITQIKKGMPVRITLEPLPDVVVRGEVAKISEYPAPTSWHSSNIQRYDTTIEIIDPPKGLKSGMTAKVEILVERLPNVLQVPVEAILEHGNKHYCVMSDGNGGWTARKVKTGSTNDKFMVIEKGLKEGDEVVLGAAAYREEVDLPVLSPKDRKHYSGKGRPDGKNRPGRPGFTKKGPPPGEGPPPKEPPPNKPEQTDDTAPSQASPSPSDVGPDAKPATPPKTVEGDGEASDSGGGKGAAP